MDSQEKGNWIMGICAWYVLGYIGFLIIGGLFAFCCQVEYKQLPEEPSFTLEQLQETPCLGCQWLNFQQTSKGQQYCCRIKDIDVLEHPSQCTLKSYCLEQGTNEFNKYTQILQWNSKRDDQERVYSFFFWGIIYIGFILIGIGVIRFIYLYLFSWPRPIQRMQQWISHFIKRRKSLKQTKTSPQVFNEEMETKSPCFDKSQTAGPVEE